MIDFHTHILPQMDDGPTDVAQSLAMLRRSFLQGVDVVVSTSHFYADEEYPQAFLHRRSRRLEELQEAMLLSSEVYSAVVPGAEVLYFPGISGAEEIGQLVVGSGGSILIEPPMAPWSEDMLDEIVRLGKNLNCTPVVAHVDRFMGCLHDETLMDRVCERGLLVQVNADYFLNTRTVKAAIRHLKKGNIHLIGSDCHNLDSRPPNLGAVRRQIRAFGAETEFHRLQENAAGLLRRKGQSI